MKVFLVFLALAVNLAGFPSLAAPQGEADAMDSYMIDPVGPRQTAAGFCTECDIYANRDGRGNPAKAAHDTVITALYNGNKPESNKQGPEVNRGSEAND